MEVDAKSKESSCVFKLNPFAVPKVTALWNLLSFPSATVPAVVPKFLLNPVFFVNEGSLPFNCV